MATGYTRNDTANNISNGSIINASDLDGEFDAVQAAMDATDGHSHDGTVGGGAPILSVGPAKDIVVSATALRPKTDNVLDLGASAVEFKNLYLDGTAYIDTLQVDESATITANLTVSGNTTLGNAATDTVTVNADIASHLIPATDNTHDLGTATEEWRNLYIDGTANIDTLLADTATIGGGTATLSSATVISDTGGTTTLQRDDTAVLAGEILGRINFQAPNVAGGGDAIVVAASVKALAESTFDATTNDTALAFYTATSGTAEERLRIDASGNVGIGTLVPDKNLHVSQNGTATVRIENTNTNLIVGSVIGSLEFEGNDLGASGVTAAVRAEADSVTGNAALVFDTGTAGAAAERMRISSSGNVGLGTSSPATALDVTGTITADGLTVDGSGTAIDLRSNNNGGTALNTLRFTDTDPTAVSNAEIGKIEFYSTDTSAVVASIAGRNTDSSPDGYLQFNTAEGATLLRRMRVDNNGDISFYDTAGTDAKFFWDTSAESLGIGTSSPSAKLTSQVNTFTDADKLAFKAYNVQGVGVYASFQNSTTGTAFTDGFRVGVDDSENALLLNLENTNMVFGTNSTESMRIDASGNLLVGTTSENPHANSAGTTADNGTALDAGGYLSASRYNSASGYFNRTATDGEIVQFRRDGTVVGSIGTNGGSPYFTTTDGGFRIAGNGALQPATSTGSVSDALEDLGSTSGRWKDLYLSGGISNPAADGTLTFTTNDAVRLQIDASGNVGIGSAAPATNLEVRQFGGTPTIRITNSDGTMSTGQDIGKLEFFNSDASASGPRVASYILSQSAGVSGGGDLQFGTSVNGGTVTESMRLGADGNLLVGMTSSSATTDGCRILGVGTLTATRDGSSAAVFNRKTSDGSIVEIRKDSVVVGSIGATNNNMFVNASGGNYGILQVNGNNRYTWYDMAFYPEQDNVRDLGTVSQRWDDVYATNGTIQTSDRNEKQDIDVLNAAETAVAQACKGLLRKFRWKDAVAEKGDAARIHFGIIAQDLQAAFEAEGLDAGNYAMFIHSTWTDEETGEERSRMGVRYPELLAFIIAAL